MQQITVSQLNEKVAQFVSQPPDTKLNVDDVVAAIAGNQYKAEAYNKPEAFDKHGNKK